jgi:uncharacterized protein (TIGR00730 family)
MALRRVCVFCGSSSGFRPGYVNAARELGTELARRNIDLVYGGAKVGLMGALADSCLAAGGHVSGVMPQSLIDREVAHTGLSVFHVVTSMHERKALMAELADAFIALPGGFGTFDEFCEMLTWSQLGIQRKACGLVDLDGFYAPLLALFDRAVAEGFLRPQHRAMVIADESAVALLDRLVAYDVPDVPKWVK